MTTYTNPSYVLITGASSGIGRSLAIEAAIDGRNLILISQDKQKLDFVAHKIAAEYKVKIVAIAQDLSQPNAAHVVYDAIQKRKITIDTIINNAGLGVYGEFQANNSSRLHEMLMVNIVALTELTRLFLPDLLKLSHAQILNVASVAGFLPGPLMSAYFASKHYVLSFSESLYEELRNTNVSVTCLCPPATKTKFAQSAHVAPQNYIATTKLSPAFVARYGYKAMKKRRPVVIYGTLPRIFIVFVCRFAPRFVLRKLMYILNSHGR